MTPWPASPTSSRRGRTTRVCPVCGQSWSMLLVVVEWRRPLAMIHRLETVCWDRYRTLVSKGHCALTVHVDGTEKPLLPVGAAKDPAGSEGTSHQLGWGPEHRNRRRQLETVPTVNHTLDSPGGHSPETLRSQESQDAPVETHCEPQGFSSPSDTSIETFTLGGQSDSLYEYLPKVTTPVIPDVTSMDLTRHRSICCWVESSPSIGQCTSKRSRRSRNVSCSGR